MEKESRENLEEVLEYMNDKDLAQEVDLIKEQDPLLSLRNTIYSFFQTRIGVITNESKFKQLVKEQVIAKIADPEQEITFAQLVSLYKDLNVAENHSINTLLDVFKPTKEGAISPLVTDNSGSGQVVQLPKTISPDEAEGLNMIISLIQNAAKEKPKEEE